MSVYCQSMLTSIRRCWRLDKNSVSAWLVRSSYSLPSLLPMRR
ncbi:Uncharacterised protein [Vibrio cholerae]|nr:Uncharacterised protein [Vibrio cholerae]